MEARFTNGSFLHRIWPNTGSPELLGAFQYQSDAEELARIMVARDAEHKFGPAMYVVTCTYSGKMVVTMPEKTEPAK